MQPKLKEINGRYYQQCKVVMLATENPTQISRDILTGNLIYSKIQERCLSGYHLYILSDEEIKEGDWCFYEKENRCFQATFTDVNNIYAKNPAYRVEGIKKIISTTDTSLGLPQPSQSFIKKYVEGYNSDNVIEDVLVQYDMVNINHDTDFMHKYVPELKVDLDNTITIKKTKDSYSREEVLMLLQNCWQQATRKTIEPLTEKGFTSFINDNL